MEERVVREQQEMRAKDEYAKNCAAAAAEQKAKQLDLQDSIYRLARRQIDVCKQKKKQMRKNERLEKHCTGYTWQKLEKKNDALVRILV